MWSRVLGSEEAGGNGLVEEALQMQRQVEILKTSARYAISYMKFSKVTSLLNLPCKITTRLIFVKSLPQEAQSAETRVETHFFILHVNSQYVSSLRNLIREMTVRLTFEKSVLRGAQSEEPHSFIVHGNSQNISSLVNEMK